jgi:23S rRNA pseudouridine955/2504/2580 synthase
VPRQRLDDIAARIIYEDDSLLVVDKPSGLAVHGGSGLNYGLIEGLRQLRQDGVYLELVHRLDRDTSGLVMVAKRPALLRELHRQLREKHIDKRYKALVAGSWPSSLKRIDAPLEKNVLQSGERMVRVSRDGKTSVTEFRVLERFDNTTLVEVSPITGRTHQIRVHALHAGFPILGDTKYSDARSPEITRQIGLRRLFLHAANLNFVLPDRPPMALAADLGPELDQILINIRK